MTIALLVMTDGRRDCIEQTIPSALAALNGPITRRFIHDDSGDDDYRQWLSDRFPTFTLITTNGRSGFGGAYRNAWNTIAAVDGIDHVFSTEDDFVFNRRVDLEAMSSVLRRNRHLVQIVLRRQAWNARERAAGGIIEADPDDFADGIVFRQPVIGRDTATHETFPVVAHRKFYSTNPSLHRWVLCERGWPVGDQSEGRLGIALREEDPEAWFAFWGTKSDAPWVEHIGRERVGTGY